MGRRARAAQRPARRRRPGEGDRAAVEPLRRVRDQRGELARLLGTDVSWVDAHRLAAARKAAERFDAVVLLKGQDTIVASPEGGVVVSDFGLPSLASAGTGDVLTGIVVSFLAKGLEPNTAAAAAAVAHGCAARLMPPRAGLVASDLLDAIPLALEA